MHLIVNIHSVILNNEYDNNKIRKRKKLQAKRWENEDHWDTLNDLLVKELDEILLIEPENTSGFNQYWGYYSDMGENEKALEYLKRH